MCIPLNSYTHCEEACVVCLCVCVRASSDETKAFPASNGTPSQSDDSNRQVWLEDFAPVAQSLLDRIKTYTSSAPK